MSSRYDPYNAQNYRGSSQGGRSRINQGGGQSYAPSYTPTVNRLSGGTSTYVSSDMGNMGGASAQDVGAVGSTVGREGALNTGLVDQYDPERLLAESQEATFADNVNDDWEMSQRDLFGTAPLASDFTEEEFGMGASSAYRAATDEYAPIEDYIQGGKLVTTAADYFGASPEEVLPRVLADVYDVDSLNSIDTYLTKSRTDTFNEQLLKAGYTEEELSGLNLVTDLDVNEFVDETGKVDTQAYGAAQRNAFNDSAVKFVDLYDAKQTDKFDTELNTLSGLRETNPEAFMQAYYNADSGTRNRYLYDSYSKGDISEDKFKQGVVESLARDGKQIINFEGEYYYYEAPEGSDLTSYSPNGTEQFFKVNFTPEQFEKTPPRMSMGQGMFKDSSGSTIYTGTDALGQLEGVGGYTNFTLDEEAQGRHKDVSYLDVGIGSQGEAYNPLPSKAKEIAKTAVRIGAGVLTGGMSEVAVVAGKAATGQTLHGEDYATLATFGLGQAGLISPPTNASPEGVGLGSLTYNQTTGVINAIGSGNPTSFIVKEFVTPYVEDAIKTNMGGVADDWQEYWDTVPTDIKAGLNEAAHEMMQGSSFEKAAGDGVIAWAEASGNRDKIEDALGKAGRAFDDTVLQPIKEQTKEALAPISSLFDIDTPEGIKAIEDAAKDIGSGIADAGTPIKEGVEEIGSSIAEAAEPFKEPLQETGRFIDDNLLQPAKDALLAGGGAMLTGMVGGGQPSGTRTTDSLFRDELFKFSPVEFTNVERVVQPQQAAQVEEEEEVDLFSSPFTSSLDRYTV